MLPRGVKIADETYSLLVKLQKVSLGKPSIKSLIDEAVKLYAEKHLKKT
mgnify:CR=1 FL=1